MPYKVITLDDGFKITDVICDKCKTHHQITHEDVTFVTCYCGERLMNIAYYYYNKDGLLDFNEDYWNEKKKMNELTINMRKCNNCGYSFDNICSECPDCGSTDFEEV
jgi:hypothetical protein